MTKKPLTSEELRELTGGPEPAGPESVVDLEPGSAGNLPGTVAARLAESLPQRGGDPARGVGLRAAGAAAGPGFRRARARGAAAVRGLHERPAHLGARARAGVAGQPGGVFLGGVRLSRDAADRGRRPGHAGRGPRQVGQRPGHRLCRHQPVLPGRLFPAGDRCEQLADGILHAAEPEEPARSSRC